MNTDQDYRLFLNSEFVRVHEKLDYIKEQTTKTNSRVADVEGRVSDVEDDVVKHPTNCPHVAKIEDINKDLEVYRVIKKYPKLVLLLIAIFVIGMIVSAIGTFETIVNKAYNTELKKSVDNINYRLAPYRSLKDTVK